MSCHEDNEFPINTLYYKKLQLTTQQKREFPTRMTKLAQGRERQQIAVPKLKNVQENNAFSTWLISVFTVL